MTYKIASFRFRMVGTETGQIDRLGYAELPYHVSDIP
jgi:hypothetical protein